jgi:hypothetical protein
MANEPARNDMEPHYALGLEEGRLFRNGKPRLEFVRTLTSVLTKNGLVGATGVEPVTSSLSWKRSYQLSYAPG